MVRTGLRISGLDNPGAFQRVREAVATIERTNAGRLSRAQDGAWSYRNRQERERYEAEIENETEAQRRHRQAQAAVKAVEDAEEAAAVAARKRQMDRIATDEHAQWREGPAGRSVGGYAGLVDERIEAARAAGKFKHNKFRGKPLVRDVEDYNPFLNREEFLMNRIMKRQGWSPPWVELQSDIEKEIASFRSRTRDNWVRRASRMISASAALTSSCDPLPTSVLKEAWAKGQAAATTKPTPQLPHLTPLATGHRQGSGSADPDKDQLEHIQAWVLGGSAEPGHGMLLEICKSYRDPDWVEKETKYHYVELQDLNAKIRRFNGIAPYHTRRSLLDREIELERIFSSAPGKIATQVSQDIRDKREGRLRSGGTASHVPKREKPTYDIWGNEIIQPLPPPVDPVSSDFFDLQPERGASGGSRAGGSSGWSHDQGAGQGASGIGLALLVRRTTDWVRGRIGI